MQYNFIYLLVKCGYRSKNLQGTHILPRKRRYRSNIWTGTNTFEVEK